MGGASSVTYRVYKDDSMIADGLSTTTYTDQLPLGQAAAVYASYHVTAVNDAGESAQAGDTCVDLSQPSVDPVGCVGAAWAFVWWLIGQVL
jgi:hypothetical protein